MDETIRELNSRLQNKPVISVYFIFQNVVFESTAELHIQHISWHRVA